VTNHPPAAAATQSPIGARRRLGAELRRLRTRAGLTLDDVAVRMTCSTSKISRLETGKGVPKVPDVSELMRIYGVVSDAERDLLLRLVHEGREHGWWETFTEGVQPERHFLDRPGRYASLESDARRVRCFDFTAVHGLLQTEDYMRAVAAADARYGSDEQRAHAMEVKLNRQRIVVAGRAPDLDVVVTEGALRQTVGAPRVMREQLGRLAGIAATGYADGLPDGGAAATERSRVSLRVLPFAAGAQAAAGCGSMTLLRFAEAPEIGVIHLAALSGGISLQGREEVVRYQRAFDRLRAAALAPSRSAQLIRVLSRSYNG
jgi:transcriptional regulator with XRE-family HTH domain